MRSISELRDEFRHVISEKKRLVVTGAILGVLVLALAVVYWPGGPSGGSKAEREHAHQLSASMQEQEKATPPAPVADNPDPQPGLGPIKGDP